MIKLDTLKETINKVGTPLFVYDSAIITNNLKRIFDSAEKYGLEKRLKLYVSYFSNSNPHLSRIIKDSGVGILVQTEEELYQLEKFSLASKDIMVSPTYLSNDQIDFWVSKNIPINLASLEEISYLVSKYPDFPVSFRIDGSLWQTQRTGIKRRDFPKLRKFLLENKIVPNSFHIYCGTGSTLAQHKRYLVRDFRVYKKYFNEVKQINLGGGFGFDYQTEKMEEKHFDWDGYFSFLHNLIIKYNIPDEVSFILEPGRDVLADSGDFIVKINRVIQRGKEKTISTDGSYVYLPSAKMKNRQHRHNFYSLDLEKIRGNDFFWSFINGSTTLSSDYVLPQKTKVPMIIKEGDYVIIHDVGAYGSTEKLEFLNKKPCAEVLVKNEMAYLITKRGSNIDKIRNVPDSLDLIK
jgi:diaminopimelate decarboxylase